MKCLTWNIEWRSPRTARGRYIQDYITDLDPDVICFTEIRTDMIPQGGYTIEADPDYGYPHVGNRRKVVLWSKTPWEQIDVMGSSGLPSGRFVSGITQGVRFVGVCVPWKSAHVGNGRRDRITWEDHRSYLDGMVPLLENYLGDSCPVCVTGDYNQRIPKKSQPLDVFEKLTQVMAMGFNVVTAGVLDQKGEALIDHVAVSDRLDASVSDIIPKVTECGLELSDHVGVQFDMEIR